MPTITIYTDPNGLGQCDVPAFVIGDSSDQWTLVFDDGTGPYSPQDVSMRLGYVNGLTQAKTGAFRLVDRGGNFGKYHIAKAGNIYSLTLDAGQSSNPPSLLGSNGAYLARGAKVARGIKEIFLASRGANYATPPRVVIAGDGTGAAATAVLDSTVSSRVSGVRHVAEVEYGDWIEASIAGGGGTGAELGPPEISRFRVTGLLLDGRTTVNPIIEIGLSYPVIFSGTVAPGQQAAQGYVMAGPRVGASDYGTAVLVLTQSGVYLDRPAAYYQGPGSVPTPVFVDGTAIYAQPAIRGGAGYTSTPTPSFTPSGSGLTCGTPVMSDTNNLVDRFVESIPVTNGGSGYNFAPAITVSGCRARAEVSDGVVTRIILEYVEKRNYVAPPAVTIATTPTAAQLAQSLVTETLPQSAGELRGATISAGGSGYTSAPLVHIVSDNSPGSGAAMRAIITGDAVTALEIIDHGAGYSSTNPPDIVFTGGGL